MRWVKNKIDMLIEFVLKFFFNRDSFLGKRYGLSFDGNITISGLVSPMPNISDFYEVVKEGLIYEVMQTSVEDNLVYIREVGTDTIYPIHAELFIMLFVKKDKFDVFTLK